MTSDERHLLMNSTSSGAEDTHGTEEREGTSLSVPIYRSMDNRHRATTASLLGDPLPRPQHVYPHRSGTSHSASMPHERSVLANRSLHHSRHYHEAGEAGGGGLDHRKSPARFTTPAISLVNSTRPVPLPGYKHSSSPLPPSGQHFDRQHSQESVGRPQARISHAPDEATTIDFPTSSSSSVLPAPYGSITHDSK